MWKLLKTLFYIIGIWKLSSLCSNFIKSFFEKPRHELDKEKLKAELAKFEAGDNVCDKAILSAINWRLAREESVYSPYFGPLQFDEDAINSLTKSVSPSKPSNILFSAFDRINIWTKSLDMWGGYNLLHYTARYGSLAIIRHLMKCGFRFDLTSTNPMTFTSLNTVD